MFRLTRLAAVLSLLALASTSLSAAEACCGPNRSAEFFAHQPHAFSRNGHPGYLERRAHRRHRAMMGAAR